MGSNNTIALRHSNREQIVCNYDQPCVQRASEMQFQPARFKENSDWKLSPWQILETVLRGK